MSTDYSAKVIVGVKASSFVEEIPSVKTKYDQDTGEPFQVSIKKYKIFDEIVDSIFDSVLIEDLEDINIELHTVGHLSDVVLGDFQEWKDRVVLGIQIKESDLYDNLCELSTTEITEAEDELIKALDAVCSAKPKIHLLLDVSY
jgi:hypothetical protein